MKKRYRVNERRYRIPANLRRSPPDQVGTLPWWRTFGLMPVGIVLLVLVLTLPGLGRSPSPSQLPTPSVTSMPSPSVAPTLPPIISTATPSCFSAASYLDIITGHEQRSQWDTAATTAELALKDSRVCDDDKQALANKYVADKLESLWERPFDATPRVQQGGVDMYRSLKEQAKAQHAPFPLSDIQVAKRAYQTSQWLVAIAALDDAFATGEFTPTDRGLLSVYVSSLFNLGKYWTNPPLSDDSATYKRGLELLVASSQIDERYAGGDRSAWGRLRELVGTDAANWPEPAATLLLKS